MQLQLIVSENKTIYWSIGPAQGNVLKNSEKTKMKKKIASRYLALLELMRLTLFYS